MDVAVGAILVRFPPGHQDVSEGVKLGDASMIDVVVDSSSSLGIVATIARLVEVVTQRVDVIKKVGVGVTINSVCIWLAASSDTPWSCNASLIIPTSIMGIIFVCKSVW